MKSSKEIRLGNWRNTPELAPDRSATGMVDS